MAKKKQISFFETLILLIVVTVSGFLMVPEYQVYKTAKMNSDLKVLAAREFLEREETNPEDFREFAIATGNAGVIQLSRDPKHLQLPKRFRVAVEKNAAKEVVSEARSEWEQISSGLFLKILGIILTAVLLPLIKLVLEPSATELGLRLKKRLFNKLDDKKLND